MAAWYASEVSREHSRRRGRSSCATPSSGTHNSYHRAPEAALLSVLLQFDPQFIAWEYSHYALYDQFVVNHVRQVELDVFADPLGGHYARRGGLIALGQDPQSGIPELQKLGFKVLHIQDLDFQTTCYSFVDCLKGIKKWSNGRTATAAICRS